MRAPTSALLASLLMLTVGGAHPTDGQETRPFTEPARTHLLLQAHTPNSAVAQADTAYALQNLKDPTTAVVPASTSA